MGSAFAAQEFGVTPDLITMAKATTNGIVPMGAVAVKEEIYDTVMDASPKGVRRIVSWIYLLRDSHICCSSSCCSRYF